MLGDDLLAEWYVARTLENKATKASARCSVLTLRGRISTRRGDRDAAVDHWQAAARLAIEAHVPFMAWIAGRQCGGAEGEQLIQEACAAMGRRDEEVLREFQEATDGEPEAASDIGVPMHAKTSPPALPRRHSDGSLVCLMPKSSSVHKLQASSRLHEAVVDQLKIVTFNTKTEKHAFTPPASHELALSTVEQLQLVREELIARGGLEGADRLFLKRFLSDRVRPFLELWIQKARDPETTGHMRELAWRAGGHFRNIYLDTLQKTKDDDPQGDKGFANMVRTLSQYHQAASTRGARLRQETCDVVELFHHALKPHDMLQKFADEVVAGSGGKVAKPRGRRVQLKHFWRAMEKTALNPSPECQWEANRIFDVARDGLEFCDYASMERAISMICTSDRIEVLRIKDRISSVEKATALGWTDVVINLRFHADVNRHICELQLFHETSMKCRSLLGGHTEYVLYRTIAELFEVNQMQLNI
eukprot:gnl/TRDRNA2_/TRDRNA2_121925_c0_seq1.p1 gnl/TRDRNA2_/TRDRNA2_121925_c0~~gnl/TRDRNA2_/TRDRNA2_121925_c0_seq1.p1  ORF type:complete len:521 (-),score=83.70 gnl/TRDRNA2_/TRDRNA2_121925_c0_seq1:144-1571(-)